MPRKIAASKKRKTDTETEHDPDQLRLIKCLQTTLFSEYNKHLKLNFPLSVTECSKFVNNFSVVVIDIRMKKEVLALVKEGRYDLFLHIVNKLTTSNRFLGSSILSILELIMTMNTKTLETPLMTSRLIQSASLTFENVVDNFPPSWLGCGTIYKNLLLGPVDMEIDFKSIQTNNTDGLFQIILALINDVLQDEGADESNSQPFDSFANFQQFERSVSSKCCYSKLSRDEKIERLFVVLNLLVKLMEIDLFVWINRYTFKTRTVMSDPNAAPLIGHLLWKESECGQMNVSIRNILKLFSTLIWIKFDEDKVDILARLVNLISVAVNLSEHNQQDNLVTYPKLNSLNETFALEVIKSIEAFPYTIDFYLRLIKHIRSPTTRLIIVNRLLSKFSKDFQGITIRKIVENLSNKVWMAYETNERTQISQEQSSHEYTKYPVYNPSHTKKSKKHLEMYRDDYLHLLLHQFESYIEVYRTHDIFEALFISRKQQNDIAASDEKRQAEYNQLNDKANYEKSCQFNFSKLLPDWKILISKTEILAARDPIYIPESVKCDKLYVDPPLCVRSVEDLEYILKLRELIDRNLAEFGNQFKKWHSVIRRYLAFIE